MKLEKKEESKQTIADRTEISETYNQMWRIEEEMKVEDLIVVK